MRLAAVEIVGAWIVTRAPRSLHIELTAIYSYCGLGIANNQSANTETEHNLPSRFLQRR